MKDSDIEYLWHDRKRFMGMPLSFTRYMLSDDRLFLEKGFFNTKADEILLYRVRDISLQISLGQKIFGVGSVIVASSDKSTPELVLKNIKAPRRVKELLHKQVEEMKLARRARVSEIMSDDISCEHDLEDSDGMDEML